MPLSSEILKPSEEHVRVCMVAPYFPPHAPGGGEISTQEMCRRLAEQGHSVIIVVPAPDGRARLEWRDGYRIQWAACPTPAGGSVSSASTYMQKPSFARALGAAVLASAQSVGATVIHAQNAQVYRAALLAGSRAKLPVIATVRDPTPLCPTGVCLMDGEGVTPEACRSLPRFARCHNEFLRQIGFDLPAHKRFVHMLGQWRNRQQVRRQLRSMTACVAISQALRDALVRERIVRPNAALAVHNFPLEIRRASPPAVAALQARHGLDGNRYFLVAGKKSTGKGIPVAVSAATMLVAAVEDARVAFAGGGPPVHPVPGVIDLPIMPQDELHQIMQGAAGVLIPSRVFEGLHRGMLDALVLGLPLVVTDAGGPREGVVEGENGFVVPRNDASGLADAMRRVLEGGEAFREQAERTAGLLLQSRFSPATLMLQWLDIYRNTGPRS
jgi:glycosyltransferase involved in cell wall biosynthesis